MAFDPKTLVPINYGNGFNVFAYKTADALATVIASGYFNAIAADLNQGDQIIASTSIGGTVLVDVLVVTSATGAATVTTTNGT